MNISPSRVLVEFPRWLLLVALVLAPWLYGSTRPWAILAITILALVISATWALECLLRKRKPELPHFVWLIGLLILLQGWWMVVNSKSTWDAAADTFIAKTPMAYSIPGSLEQNSSLQAMMLITGLLGVFLFCCDLVRRPVWRDRLLCTMAWTGFSIAGLGILQKLGGEPVLALTWEEGKRDLANNFGMYRYRGNAGAFLDLILPIAAGMALLCFQRPEPQWKRAAWVAGLILLLFGIQLNPSRLGWVLAVVLLLLLATLATRHYWNWVHGNLRAVSTCAILAVALLMILAWFSIQGNWTSGFRRARQMGLDPSSRSPTEIYLGMIPDAGLLGFGPGTFSKVFPQYQQAQSGSNYPEFWTTHFWNHAHQDYLQTMIEWGCWGSLCWGLLIFGGVIAGLLAFLRKQPGSPNGFVLGCVILAVLGILVYARFDFPLQIASLQLYVAVLLGICWGSKTSLDPGR